MRVNHESLLTLKMIASKRERLNRVYKGPDFPDEVKKNSGHPAIVGLAAVLSLTMQSFIYVGVLV